MKRKQKIWLQSLPNHIKWLWKTWMAFITRPTSHRDTRGPPLLWTLSGAVTLIVLPCPNRWSHIINCPILEDGVATLRPGIHLRSAGEFRSAFPGPSVNYSVGGKQEVLIFVSILEKESTTSVNSIWKGLSQAFWELIINNELITNNLQRQDLNLWLLTILVKQLCKAGFYQL